ncbi:pseudouridine synthase [Albibacterium bauzanense]|uniref:Pseudouridine synthase n=1 Tax=Albibacterium bauzanense TaxID=653929 RepID=A0A4R1LWI5_9SPHI|nr:pseudouridine synthase [Albibacterium bauzanense]TCK83232.1 23S rRNA pseudouridine2605 synthase [Albibacterium bauzanense]
MPFNNKRNSRDGKSNHGGKPSFGRKAEGSTNRDNRFDDRKPHSKRSDQAPGASFDAKKSDDNRQRPYKKTTTSSSRFSKSEDRPFKKDDNFKREDRPFKKSGDFKKDERSKKDNLYKKENHFKKEDKPFRKPGEFKKTDRPRKDTPFKKDDNFKREDRPFKKSNDFKKEDGPRRENSFKREDNFKREDKPFRKSNDLKKGDRPRRDTPYQKEEISKESKPRSFNEPELIRLNRYIANAGICSRRKADELIEAGVVSINGEVVTSLGTRVNPATDEVKYNGERLKREKMVYILLNKPKDYITTTDDPQERRTVMHLVDKATRERIYPVGRLDRNTTGLLLMTNDGELAEKLSHPRNSITKIYQVELNKNLSQGDFNKIEYGIELEDGLIKPDDISYVQGASKKEVGIQIHSGKNRIVRRIFEHLGYDVIKLDRVIYANLSKKDLPRGRWRHLDEKEVIQLKHFIK